MPRTIDITTPKGNIVTVNLLSRSEMHVYQSNATPFRRGLRRCAITDEGKILVVLFGDGMGILFNSKNDFEIVFTDEVKDLLLFVRSDGKICQALKIKKSYISKFVSSRTLHPYDEWNFTGHQFYSAENDGYIEIVNDGDYCTWFNLYEDLEAYIRIFIENR
jgi:hypothetical protein